MRVISQNNQIDVPYEMTAFHVSDNIIRMNMIGDTGKGSVMAVYSTPEKAEKAMQKLHEAYAPEPLFIHKDISPDERAAAGEISWTQALDEMHTEMFVRPISSSSIEQVYTGNIVFRFPREDEL